MKITIEDGCMSLTQVQNLKAFLDNYFKADFNLSFKGGTATICTTVIYEDGK